MAGARVLHLQMTLIGDEQVGKDFLLTSLTQVKSNAKYQPTNGALFYVNKFDNVDCRATFYSVSGKDMCRSLLPMYFNQANLVLICYDVSNKASFDHACDSWLKEAKEFNEMRNGQMEIFLVGLEHPNKEAVVKKEDADKFAADNHIQHANTKLGDQLEAIQFFESIIKAYKKTQEDVVKPAMDPCWYEAEQQRKAQEEEEAKKNLQTLMIKIALGILLAAILVTAAVFLWPFIVASASIVAAAATISAITTAYLGLATTAATFATILISSAAAAILSFGSFLISKITDAVRSAPVKRNDDDLLDDVRESKQGLNTFDILERQGKWLSVKKEADCDSDSESDWEFLDDLLTEESPESLTEEAKKKNVDEALAFIKKEDNDPAGSIFKV